MKVEKSGKIVLIGLAMIVIVLVYRCPFRLFLGLSCPGCGMTRAFMSVFKGKIGMAFFYHPLFPVVILLGIGYLLWKFNKIKLSDAAISKIVVGTAILFLLVYLIRIGMQSEVVQLDFNSSLIGRGYQKLR